MVTYKDDLDMMLERSYLAGVKSMIITGGSLHESELALNLARQKGWFPVCLLCLASWLATGFYATIGCHPTRSKEFDRHPGGPDAYLLALDKLIGDNLRPSGRVVAIGECGLGGHSIFSRGRTGVIHFLQIMIEPILHPKKCRKGIFVSVKCRYEGYSKKSILWAGTQLVLAKKYHLPLFLHSRAAHIDFVQILKEEGFGEDGGKSVGAKGGVVHSFTGSSEEAAELVSAHISEFDNHVKGGKIGMGFYIGVNGCSMKTEQNLETLKTIRLDRLLLETGKARSTVRPC